MKSKELIETAIALVAKDGGILAMDESIPSCNKLFAKLNIPQTEEYRRAYRQVLITTPELEHYINGAILSDETIYQKTDDHILFTDVLSQAGILTGIKVDLGTIDLAGFKGEKITEGLDGLGNRMVNYYALGARFAKWRAVITIGENIPSWGCIESNVHLLARYAAICQEHGIVPMVEPEVLMTGNHGIDRCYEVTKKTLHALFNELYKQRVDLQGLILKPNMILAGVGSIEQNDIQTVADYTINCLLECVPAKVPGIAFLSGGQSGKLASQHLNAMHLKSATRLPWKLSFSFGRALQNPAIEIWAGQKENTKAAQQALLQRASNNSMANQGEYYDKLEQLFETSHYSKNKNNS